MPRPDFDASIIAELRHRVAEHNEGGVGARVRLGELKKVYERNYRGPGPALRRVDGHLDKLRKAAFDPGQHPRASGGRFAGGSGGGKDGEPPAAGFALPTTKAEHRSLQESNPAYRALTTQAFVTHDMEGVGLMANLGLSAAGGAAVVLSLANGKPGPAFERAMAHVAARRAGPALRSFGRWITGPDKAGNPLEYASRRVARATGNVVGRAVGIPAGLGMRLATGNAGRGKALAGRVAAGTATGFERAAAVSNRLAGLGVRAAIHVAAGGSGYSRKASDAFARALTDAKGKQGMTDEAANEFAHTLAGRVDAGVKRRRKTAIKIGLMVPAARLVALGMPDLRSYGATEDRFDYRTIAKMASDPAAIALHGAVQELLAKGGTVDDLMKYSVIPGAIGTIGRVLRIGAAAAGGATLSGGAAAGAMALMPVKHEAYRDPHGRFTSRDKAVMHGAVIAGAVAAGAAAFIALRHHNTTMFNKALVQLVDLRRAGIAAATSEASSGVAAEMIRNKEKAIASAVIADAAHNQALADLNGFEFGGVHAMKSKMRQHVDEQLAHELFGSDEFLVPQPNGSLRRMLLHRDDSLTSTGVTKISAVRSLASSIGRMTDEDFAAATAKMSPGHQNTARTMFARRQGYVDSVGTQLDESKQHLDLLTKSEGLLRAALKKAQDDHGLARSQLKVELDESLHPALQEAVDAAAVQSDAAKVAHEEIASALAEIKRQPSGVLSPYTGKALAPATQHEISDMTLALHEEAKARATSAVEAKIAVARTHQEVTAEQGYLLLMASKFATGAHYGAALPASTRHQARRWSALYNVYDRARKALGPAEHAVIAAKVRARGLQSGKGNVALKAGAALQDGIERSTHDTAIAALQAKKAALVAARSAYTRARVEVLTVGSDYAAMADAASKVPPRMPSQVVRELARVAGGAKGALASFAKNPSAKRVAEFAKKQAKSVGRVAGNFGSSVAAGVKHEFFHDVPGKGPMPKLGVMLAASGTASAAFGTAAVHFLNVRDKLTGTPAQQKKASWLSPDGGVKIETRKHAVTGVGYTVATIPDPDNKQDRLIVWGEMTDTSNRVLDLHFGGKLSELRNYVQDTRNFQNGRFNSGNQGGVGSGGFNSQRGNQVSQGNGGPLTHVAQDVAMPGSAEIDQAIKGMVKVQIGGGGLSTTVCDKNENTPAVVNASNAVSKFVRDQFLANGSARTTGYAGALNTIFSKQGQVLKRNAIFQLLTGFSVRGDAKGHGVFQSNPDFAKHDPSAVSAAMNKEVERALNTGMLPDDRSRAAMTLAMVVIAQVGQVNNPAAVLDKLKGFDPQNGMAPAAAGIMNNPAWRAPVGAPPLVATPAQPVVAEGAAPPPPRAEAPTMQEAVRDNAYDMTRSHRTPAHWSADDLDRFAEDGATTAGASLSLPDMVLLPVITNFARIVGEENADFTESDAVQVAVDTLSDGNPAAMTRNRQAIRENDMGHFRSLLHSNADKYRRTGGMPPLAMAASGDLRKWDEGVHPRDLIGEFGSGGGGGGSDAGPRSFGSRLADTAGDAADIKARGAMRKPSNASTPWHNPVRMATELGTAVGGELAWSLASRFIPGALQAKAGAGLANRGMNLLRSAGKFGLQSLAGLGGGLALSEAGNLGARAASGIKGETRAPEYSNDGEAAGELAGQLGGSVLGNKLGGRGVRGVTLGALGMYGGGLIGRELGRYAGFDATNVHATAKGHVQRVAGRQRQT